MQITKKTIMLAFVLLVCSFQVLSLDKFSFLTRVGGECGIVSCYTDYIAMNPTKTDVAIDSFNISSSVDIKGIAKTYDVSYYNGTKYETLKTVDQKAKSETTMLSASSVMVKENQTKQIRVYGYFSPTYDKETVSYAIDHIPSYNGYTYQEYDLWNQTWGKCINMNVTYNLNNYSSINETYPQRVLLNNSNINLSAIRSDWQDLRFAKGTCGNVTADYVHNIISYNSTSAYATFYFLAQNVINNTVAQVAIYYNNSNATHVEPSNTALSWGATSAVNNVRIFGNSKVTDNGTLSNSNFNETGNLGKLSTFGSSQIVNGTKYMKEKQLLGNASALYSYVGMTRLDTGMSGFSTAFTVKLLNTTTTNTYYLFSIGNATDNSKTKIAEMKLDVVSTSGGSNGFLNYGHKAFWNETADCAGSLCATWTGTGSRSTAWAANGTGSLDSSSTTFGYADMGSAPTNFNFTYKVNVSATTDYFYLGVKNAATDCFGDGAGVAVGNDAGSGVWKVCAKGTWSASLGSITIGVHTVEIRIVGNNYEIVIDGSSKLNDTTAAMGRYVILRKQTAGNILYDDIHAWNETATTPAATLTYTLTSTVYYYNATYNNSFSLANLQPNVSYGVGFRAGKTDANNLQTQVMFNGTLLDLNNSPKISNPYGGYPFRGDAGANCTIDTGYTCVKNYVWGANGITNSSGDVIGALNTLNGTIDEIIIGDIATANVTKFDKEMFYAWTSSVPATTFSSTYVANNVVPSLTLTLSPTSPTYQDDSNLTVKYSDSDFTVPSNITIQWRVNGTSKKNITINATSGNVNLSDVFTKGNYSIGSIVNATVWAFDGLYYSQNYSLQYTITGVKPNPVTNLACNPNNKTSINCTWTNAAGNISTLLVYLNSSNIVNVSNTTTKYNISSLYPGNYYNVSIYTMSTDGSLSNVTQNITYTLPNQAPNITDFYPSNLTPTFAEGTNQTFNVTATDDDGNPIITWFKDNIFQTIGNFFTWIIGKSEQGIHNVTAVVNDTYGATTSKTWTVTVTDDYPSPNAPVFNPNGGLYRTMIPVKCASTNSYSAVDHYDISVSVNNAAYENISISNKMGFIQYDITQYPYFTNFTFNCSATGESGNSSAVSGRFTRDYINEFYATTTQSSLDFSTMTPYTFSLYYDGQNPNKNITVKYAYSDCNGDGLYDYIYNYTSINPSRIKQRFVCVFQSGSVPFEIGVFLSKNNQDTWAGTGCSTDYDYSDTCLVKKKYILGVSG